jgi:hypothetical protein
MGLLIGQGACRSLQDGDGSIVCAAIVHRAVSERHIVEPQRRLARFPIKRSYIQHGCGRLYAEPYPWRLTPSVRWSCGAAGSDTVLASAHSLRS